MGTPFSRVNQVSVFIENRPGRLVEMLRALEENEIDIEALCVADAPDFGIVRMILPDADRGLEVLHQAGFTARKTDVLRVEIPHRPGGLADAVADPLARAGLNIEYLYASVDPEPGRAVVVVKVKDPDAAEKALTVG